MTMNRTMTLLAAVLFSVVGFSTQAGAAKTTFLLDWIIYGKHAPFFVAQDKGFFKKRGLDMEFRRGFGSDDASQEDCLESVADRICGRRVADQRVGQQ